MSDKKRTCILCGKLTEGSVGAAGLKWSFICQPCKNKEDEALASQIRYQAKVMDLAMGKKNPFQMTDKAGAAYYDEKKSGEYTGD